MPVSGVGRRTLLCAACGVAVTACGGNKETADPAVGSEIPGTTPGNPTTSRAPGERVTRGTDATTHGPGDPGDPTATGAPPSRSASPGGPSSTTGPEGTPKTPTHPGSPTANPTTANPTTPTTPPQPTGYLGPTSEVPVGGGKVYSGRNVVVTQPSSGRYVGMTATCPHQGREVGAVTGGVVECGYHGSLFSIEDGSVVNGPATKGLDPVAIEVSDGQISLA